MLLFNITAQIVGAPQLLTTRVCPLISVIYRQFNRTPTLAGYSIPLISDNNGKGCYNFNTGSPTANWRLACGLLFLKWRPLTSLVCHWQGYMFLPYSSFIHFYIPKHI